MKMRELSTEEYLKEENIFFEKHGEYFDKLVQINKEEHSITDDLSDEEFKQYLTTAKAQEFEDKRKAIEEEYKDYNDIYKTDFYCLLTKDNSDQLLGPDNTYTFAKELDTIGKLVEYDSGDIGILTGIAVCLDDFYYILDNKFWGSAVGAIRVVE